MEQKTLAVRNIEQKVLWETELAGQISDGYWENASPMDHYRSWSGIRVVVDPENVGRDFWVRKDNYSFTSKQLLEYVGDRMVFRARFARMYPELAQALVDAPFAGIPDDIDHYILYVHGAAADKATGKTGSYYCEVMDNWEKLGLTYDILCKVQAATCYVMQDLLKDLKDLKAIVRTMR